MRTRAVVLGLWTACSFQHGALTQDDAQTQVPDGSIDAPRPPDARIDAPPDSPPVPPDPVTANFPITEDTYVDSQNPTTAFGDQPLMLADGSTQPASAAFRADLSAIPTTATVQSVVLHIWVSNDAGGNVSLYKMNEAWDEATATYGMRMTNTAWAGVGITSPSRDTTALATLTPDATFTEKTATIPNTVVQAWVTAPATNYGLALATASSDGSTWRTRENPTTTARPYFVITYQPAQ